MENTWSEEYKKIKDREERFQTSKALQLNDPEEKLKQKSRIQRFETEIKEVDYWEKYSEPSGDIRTDTLYLYGVDYMSTKRIFSYFEYFSPVSVEWLNDTSCNVVFPTKDNALQALNTNCLEKIENPESFDNMKRSALGYQVNDEVMPIFIRFATAGDVKNEEVKAENSKYYKWKKESSKIRNKAIGRYERRRRPRDNSYKET